MGDFLIPKLTTRQEAAASQQGLFSDSQLDTLFYFICGQNSSNLCTTYKTTFRTGVNIWTSVIISISLVPTAAKLLFYTRISAASSVCA